VTIQEFAEQAGGTMRTTPRRNESGYRLYSDRDLERLEQIVALKFLGQPLKETARGAGGGEPAARLCPRSSGTGLPACAG